MDSGCFGHGFDVGESEREKDGRGSCGLKEIGSKGGVFVHEKLNSDGAASPNQCLSKVSGVPESATFLSEPSHIKNWFSSYAYESPSLDTYDNFGDSVGKESKCEKDGYRVEIRKRDIEEDLGDFRKSSMVEDLVDENKVSCPLDSSSHLSEPTDIRNWFSSYVYESPSLDTADGLGDSICRDRINEEDELSIENSNIEKREPSGSFGKKISDSEEVDVKQVQPEEYAKVNTYCRLSKQERELVDRTTEVDENPSGRSDLRLKCTPKGSQAKQGDAPNEGESQCKLDQEIFHVTKFTPSNNQRSSCSNDAKWPQDSIHNEASTLQESSEANVHPEKCSLLKNNADSTHGSKERKDEDGFITTRKRKYTARNDENSSTVAPICRKDVVIERRKVLAETTNYHHSPATMISGKWKCPQQRKPNLGPPMKQLGLENWFRKSYKD